VLPAPDRVCPASSVASVPFGRHHRFQKGAVDQAHVYIAGSQVRVAQPLGQFQAGRMGTLDLEADEVVLAALQAVWTSTDPREGASECAMAISLSCDRTTVGISSRLPDHLYAHELCRAIT